MARSARDPEKLSKDELLTGIGRKLKKDQLISLYKAVSHGYAPYAHHDPAKVPAWGKNV